MCLMLCTVTEEQVTYAVVCRVPCSVLPTEPMRETGKAEEEGALSCLLLFSWSCVGTAVKEQWSMEEMPRCCQRQMRGTENDVGEPSAWRSPSCVDSDCGTEPEELCVPLLLLGESCRTLVWVCLLLLCCSKLVSLHDTCVFLQGCSFHQCSWRVFEGMEIAWQPFQRCWL